MAIAFCWFTAATYGRIREISADKDRLPKTFEEWNERAQVQFDGLVERGVDARKVELDPEALLQWAQGAPINSNKRGIFAALVFAEQNASRH